MSNPLKKLKALIAVFTEKQRKYAHLGAGDTEPDWQFQNLLRQAAQGKEAKAPSTADGWELYSEEKGAGVAARSLGAAAQKVADHVTAHRTSNPEIVDYLRHHYCWRASW